MSAFPPGQQPAPEFEFHDAMLDMLWLWGAPFAYWAGKFHPIEDEV